MFTILLFNNLAHGYNIVYGGYLLLFSCFAFPKYDFSKEVYNYFRKILAIVFLISLCQWLLYLCGISFFSFYLNPLNELKQHDYIAIPPCLVVPNFILDSFRFYSCFDEPGVVGTIAGLILYIEGYKIRDPYNLIIFLAGLCAFSFFFIGATLIYISLKYLRRKPIYLFLILGACYVFYQCTKENEVLDTLVYSRLEWDSSSQSFVGDSRATDELKSYYDRIKTTSTIYFGVNENELSVFSGSYGYRNVVLRFGIIFCILYLVFYIVYAKIHITKTSDFIIFSVLLLIVFYQRPNLYDAVYIFLLTQFIRNHSADYYLLSKY